MSGLVDGVSAVRSAHNTAWKIGGFPTCSVMTETRWLAFIIDIIITCQLFVCLLNMTLYTKLTQFCFLYRRVYK